MAEAIRIFDETVKTYLSELTALGMSKQTTQNYSERLKRFRKFWIQGEPENVPAPDDIRAYRDSLSAEGLSKSTVRQYLVELKTFFEFGCDPDYGFFEKNPVSKKMYPKSTNADDKIYDKVLDAEDFKKLWVNKQPVGYNMRCWARNYAIVTLLLDGKIRNGELLELKVSDIDFRYNEIEIRRGKGGKKRWVTISPISATAIKLYLASGIRPFNLPDSDYLFGNTAETGEGLCGTWHKGTRQWLSALVEKHIAVVTGKHGFRSHALRHNGAILDLNTGVRAERLQSELGHSSITTTEIYTGRLQSVRKTRDYHEVREVRDRCAEENLTKLAAISNL